MQALDELFARLEALFRRLLLEPADAVLFWDAVFWDNGREEQIAVPIVVLWLVLGAVFFTLRFQFINFRAFRHAIDCVRGRYTAPDETGEISHFQALSAALIPPERATDARRQGRIAWNSPKDS